MKNDEPSSAADREYAAAYAAHYREKDLGEAFSRYREINTKRPESRTAGYARAQIANIAKAVVSKEAFLEAQIDLVQAYLTELESAT